MPRTDTTIAATAPDNVPAPPERPKRTKSPRYDVSRVADNGQLTLLATDVAAPTRREAIKKQDDPWGSFATARAGELKFETRDKETREEEVWK